MFIYRILSIMLHLAVCLAHPEHTSLAFQVPSLHPLFSLAINKTSKDVRRILVDNVEPSSIDAHNLLGALPLNNQHKVAARYSLKSKDMKEVYSIEKSVLTTDQVQRLKQYALEKMNGGSLDSVDGCPEWQVPVDRGTLNSIIGQQTTDRIFELPTNLLATSASIEAYKYPSSKTDVGCFIRKYEISGRPFIGFHVDDCDATINICLSDPKDCIGGRLLLIGNGKVVAPERTIGDVLIHPWYTCHAVTAVTKGERWSLIIFLSNVYPPDHSGFYKLNAPSLKKKGSKAASEVY